VIQLVHIHTQHLSYSSFISRAATVQHSHALSQLRMVSTATLSLLQGSSDAGASSAERRQQLVAQLTHEEGAARAALEALKQVGLRTLHTTNEHHSRAYTQLQGLAAHGPISVWQLLQQGSQQQTV
jgi:hypothetical protein